MLIGTFWEYKGPVPCLWYPSPFAQSLSERKREREKVNRCDLALAFSPPTPTPVTVRLCLVVTVTDWYHIAGLEHGDDVGPMSPLKLPKLAQKLDCSSSEYLLPCFWGFFSFFPKRS